MADGKITIDTKIDTKGIDKGLNDIDKKLKGVKGINFDGLKKSFSDATKETKILGTSLSDMFSGMNSGAMMAGVLGGAVASLASAFINLAMKAIQMAIQAMREFMAKGVEMASSIEESMNVIEVTFGDLDVKTWVDEMASSFNLAQDEAMKFAGTFGTIAKQATDNKDAIKDITKAITALTGDLASFYNTTNDEAFNALRAGLTGEMEQLKKYNVFMSEANLNEYARAKGIAETTRTMTEQEKILLRLNYIMEQTTDAQGDAIRTQDSYANATKQLELAMNDAGVAMGNEVLPALTDLKVMFREMISDNEELFRLLGNVVAWLVTGLNDIIKLASNAFGVLGDVLQTVAKALNFIFDTIENVRGTVSDFFKLMFGDSKKEIDATEVYMKDFAGTTTDAMQEVANATGDAFTSIRESIEGELGVVAKALEKYYDNDLKMYKQHLDRQYGESKGAEIKKARLLADREAYNKRMLEQDLINEEKKLTYTEKRLRSEREIASMQKQIMEEQTKTVEKETKKQLDLLDVLKKSLGTVLKTSTAGNPILGAMGAMIGRNRDIGHVSNSSTSNTITMNLYGSDFMTALDQAQMITRLRG